MSLGAFTRKLVRGSGFFAFIGISLLEGALLFIATRRCDRLQTRAEWLHRWCKRYQWVLGIRATSAGAVPASGLLVCNHLSYLDIVVLGAATRCVFVSKKEVRGWPVFGLCAQLAGTIFVDRERRGEVDAVAAQMEEVLRQGLLLVLFPEGTSSNGTRVLPFKTPLFEPVARLASPAAGAAISYDLKDGSVPEEICYWGEMTLAPHLMNVFSKEAIDVELRFGPSRIRGGDRKAMARELYDEVELLHSGGQVSTRDLSLGRAVPTDPLVRA